VAWIWAKGAAGGLGTPQIMDNGTESAITLTSSGKLFRVTTTSASYPSDAEGIGMRATATADDAFLYECGTLIVYRTTKLQSVTGTLSSAGALAKQSGTLQAGTVTSSGSLLKSTSRALAATLTTAGAITKTAFVANTGALALSGALQKLTARALVGSLTAIGALTKQTSTFLSGVLSLVGALVGVKDSTTYTTDVVVRVAADDYVVAIQADDVVVRVAGDDVVVRL
jgi:hypothetical protein